MSDQVPVLWTEGENDPPHQSNHLIWIDPKPGDPSRPAAFVDHPSDRCWYVYDEGFVGYGEAEGIRVCDEIYFVRFPVWLLSIPEPSPVLLSIAEPLPVLRHFSYEHLPEPLKRISAPCCKLAASMYANLPDDPETWAGLRKLLEAKDCFVRAGLVGG
jgi:hypothetical protein